MDTVTHLVAGALTPLAFRNAPKTRMLTLFGIIAGEFPDIDVIAGKSPAAILAFHRGITHALVLQPLFALLLALVFHRFLKKGDDPGGWTFAKTWSVALLALLIHLFLDCMTTFGTQVFLPFSDFRVALPAMYIIDFSLTLPLLAVWFVLLVRGGSRAPATRRLPAARLALGWLLAYPLLCLAVNQGASSYLEKRYAAQGNEWGIQAVELSPEPFAPLNWKVVGIAPETYWMGRFFLPRPGAAIALKPYARVTALWDTLRAEVPVFALYAQFASYPTESTETSSLGPATTTFRDVRYETTLPGLLKTFGRDDGYFLMQAKWNKDVLLDYRFLYRGREAGSTPWERLEKLVLVPRRSMPHAG